MLLSDDQIERWKQYRDDMFADEVFISERRQREQERLESVPQINSLLANYLAGHINNNELRSIFQQKAAGDWRSFGLGGFSGAMFLNMLVNNVPDQHEVEEQLRIILPMPESLEDGYQRLESFMEFLQYLLQNKRLEKGRIQPGFAPFFVSAWWHSQNPDEWPIYYLSGRKAFAAEGVYIPLSNQAVDDYFAFREAYVFLMEKLDLSSWELEHLCVWLRERKETTLSSTAVSPADEQHIAAADTDPDAEDIVPEHSPETITHTQVQLLLARIGQKLGCKIWIAKNDHNRVWNGERLGNYSLDSLPPYIVADPEAQRIIELIDVLWLKGHGVAAAFEIEHTTSIYSGLLRMSDLLTLQPNLAFPLYIVTSEGRIEQVKRQLGRPTFQALQLHQSCGFFAYEKLIAEAQNILRWAQTPQAIEKLAQYVPTRFHQ